MQQTQQQKLTHEELLKRNVAGQAVLPERPVVTSTVTREKPIVERSFEKPEILRQEEKVEIKTHEE